MKNLASGIACLYLLIFSINARAQEEPTLHEPDLHKPRIFADLPDRIAIDLTFLNSNATRSINNTITLPLTGRTAAVQGRVISNIEKYNGAIRSLVIRLEDRDGAVFTLSKITDTNGNTSYRGRIVSLKAGDCFELVNENGQYFLMKKDYNEMIME